MDIHQLRVFQAAVETGSFTGASNKLRISQSTISQHIKQMEIELDCLLFLRVGKRVTLTDAGRVLFEYGERIFRDLKNAQIAIREMSGLQRGHLRLGTGVTTLTHLLTPVLMTFKTRYPGIELSITTGTTEYITRLVRSQMLDLGLITLTAPARDLDVKELYSEELILAVSPRNPLARKKSITAGELSTLPFIVYEKNTVLRRIIDDFFSVTGISPVSIMEIGNVEAIKSMVMAGLGVSMLPYLSVSAEEKENKLKLMRIEKHKLHRRIGLITLKSTSFPNAVREMVKIIVSELGPKK